MIFQPVIPQEWSGALNATVPGVTDLIDTGSSDWIDTLQRLLPTVVAADQQRRVLALQLERARAGLPPIDAGAYGAGVRVGLDDRTAGLLLAGGAALALFMLLRRGR